MDTAAKYNLIRAEVATKGPEFDCFKMSPTNTALLGYVVNHGSDELYQAVGGGVWIEAEEIRNYDVKGCK